MQSRVAVIRAADRNVDRAVRTLRFRIKSLRTDAPRKDRTAQAGGAVEAVGVVLERVEQTANVDGAPHDKVGLDHQITRQFVLHSQAGLPRVSDGRIRAEDRAESDVARGLDSLDTAH